MTLCPICYEKMQFCAYTNCLHTVCVKCYLVDVQLCKRNKCLICSSASPQVCLVGNSNTIMDFNKLKTTKNMKFDKNLNAYIHQSVKIYLDSLNVPQCTKGCDIQINTFNQYVKHMQEKHQIQLCKICIKYRPIFPADQVQYTKQQAIKHSKTHQKCILCNEIQYDEELLKEHYKTKHYRCDLCRTFDVEDSYWNDLDDLIQHIEQAHITCTFKQCRQEAFGFVNDKQQIEHLLEVHQQQLTDQQKLSYNQKLKAILKQKNFIDLNKHTEYKDKYSIHNRKQGSQKIKITQQAIDINEQYLNQYMIDIKKVKKPTKQKENFVEFVDELVIQKDNVNQTKKEDLAFFNTSNKIQIKIKKEKQTQKQAKIKQNMVFTDSLFDETQSQQETAEFNNVICIEEEHQQFDNVVASYIRFNKNDFPIQISLIKLINSKLSAILTLNFDSQLPNHFNLQNSQELQKFQCLIRSFCFCSSDQLQELPKINQKIQLTTTNTFESFEDVNFYCVENQQKQKAVFEDLMKIKWQINSEELKYDGPLDENTDAESILKLVYNQ